jgi:hypothetical protein
MPQEDGIKKMECVQQQTQKCNKSKKNSGKIDASQVGLN